MNGRLEPIDTAAEIMARFSERTGLTGAVVPPRRYLWTDAFAVCNFLELHRGTGEEQYERLALRLVDQVHHALGRHRADDARTGWISGLDEEEGERRPTCGGLRIGKGLPERGTDQPYDERLEWDRDGQYFHYLTKWMHALARVARVVGEARYLAWAIDLARAAHAGFTWVPRGGGKRMHWKMSIDLSRPLVPSMGHHDPLDGWITLAELRSAAARGPRPADVPDLDAEIADLASMCVGVDWTTDDPLGLGGLLSDAYRVALLIGGGGFTETGLLEPLLRSSATGLAAVEWRKPFEGPADRRLAFRELGLSIGLQAVPRLRELRERAPATLGGGKDTDALVERLGAFVPLAERITAFWRDPAHRTSPSWLDHRDINAVMLATSLLPDGYLSL